MSYAAPQRWCESDLSLLLPPSRADRHPAALYAGVRVCFRLTLFPPHQFSWILVHALPLRGRVRAREYPVWHLSSLNTQQGVDGTLPSHRRSSMAATP